MKVFENHFGGNITIVLGNFCSNGCQLFHKNEAGKVFDKFKVPNNYREDVLNSFSDNPVIPDVTKFSTLIRGELTRHNHIDLRQQLVNDPDTVVRKQIAKHDHIELLRQLVNDPDEDVRYQVAKHDHVELLRQLVNDPTWNVRTEVAKHNNIELLNQLVNDPVWIVRYEVQKTVLKYGLTL